MLNEDKIELMTGIAMFEKREGKQIAAAGKMFKSDFVGRHMLHAFLRFTAAYVLLSLSGPCIRWTGFCPRHLWRN